jgi:amino acid permease
MKPTPHTLQHCMPLTNILQCIIYLFIYPRQPQPPHMAASLSCFSNNFNFIGNISAVRHEQRGNIKGYLTWTRG